MATIPFTAYDWRDHGAAGGGRQCEFRRRAGAESRPALLSAAGWGILSASKARLREEVE